MPHEVILNDIQYVLIYTQINAHDELSTQILTFDDPQAAEARYYQELSYGTNSDQIVSISCMIVDTRGNVYAKDTQSGKAVLIPATQNFGLLIVQSDKQGVNITRMALYSTLQDALAAMYQEIAYAKALDTISWITLKIINRRDNTIIKEERHECAGAEIVSDENQNEVNNEEILDIPIEETENYGG